MFKPKFTKTGSQCTNILKAPTNVPIPDKCRVYDTTSSCNKYEIAPNGKSVVSCEEPDACIQ